MHSGETTVTSRALAPEGTLIRTRASPPLMRSARLETTSMDSPPADAGLACAMGTRPAATRAADPTRTR